MALHYGKPLSARVVNGKMVIEIGVNVLAHAVTYSDWANPWSEAHDDHIRTFAIADPEQFAKDVVHAMLNEREDGSTPLSDFIDKASRAAIDDGSLGLDERFDHVIKHGQTAEVETWATDTEQ